VNSLLGQSIDSLRELLGDQDITVVREHREDLPVIQADEMQIEQALQNILRNAVEAMPDGGTLTTMTTVAEDGTWVEIRIQDTGHGIPDQDRERVFQSFFTTKIKGTGLGLTIVQRVLKNHDGEIVLEQPEGGGTRVVVLLPMRAHRQMQNGEPDLVQKESSSRKSERMASRPDTVQPFFHRK
jgi:signal transduction histidine kinase